MTALQKNGTVIPKSAFPATPFTDPDPMLVLTADVYEGGDYEQDGRGFQQKQTKKFLSGQKIRTSERDAMYPTATATGVTPATGPLAGGTVVTIDGTKLAGVTGVTVGGVAATAVKVLSDKQVRVTTPAGTAGAKAVVVQDDGGNITIANGFTYA